MRYIFENENALELYYHITKNLEIEICPGESFDDEVCISEAFLMACLTDILTIQKDK